VWALRSPRDRGRFVQDEPVQSQLTDRLNKLVKLGGLAHEAVGAQVVAANAILILAGPGKNHYRQMLCGLVANSGRRRPNGRRNPLREPH
jgi:hypothetical protein